MLDFDVRLGLKINAEILMYLCLVKIFLRRLNFFRNEEYI